MIYVIAKDSNTRMRVQNPKRCGDIASRNTPPMRAPSTPAEDERGSKNVMQKLTRNTKGRVKPAREKWGRKLVCKRVRIKNNGMKSNAVFIDSYFSSITKTKSTLLTSKNNERLACWNDFVSLASTSRTLPIRRFLGKIPPRLAESTVSPGDTLLS